MATGTARKLLVLLLTTTSLAMAAPIKAMTPGPDVELARIKREIPSFEEFPEVMTTETGTQTMGNGNAELGNADVTAPGARDIRVIEPFELVFALIVIAFFLACFAMILGCLYWLGIQILKVILWTRGENTPNEKDLKGDKDKPNEKDLERGEDTPNEEDLERGDDEVIVDEDFHSILSFVTEEDKGSDQESNEPGEVKGILGKGKRNKAIKWKSDAKLVDVKYFEMDEDERVNVNKLKFENMRAMELKMEKEAVKHKYDLDLEVMWL